MTKLLKSDVNYNEDVAMKKTITLGAHFGSLFILLLTVNAPMSLLRFIMIGELPGGQVIFSANTMLYLIAATAIIFALYLASKLASPFRLKSSHHNLPKRRYSTIQ